MANEKYNNLTTLMTSGKLNWAGDAITAYLMQGVVFDATDVKLQDAGGTRVAEQPLRGRSVDADGNLLGLAVSFNYVPKDQPHQVLIGKDFGPGMDVELLAFYDQDADGNWFSIKNNGSLIIRPQDAVPRADTGQGIWIGI